MGEHFSNILCYLHGNKCTHFYLELKLYVEIFNQFDLPDVEGYFKRMALEHNILTLIIITNYSLRKYQQSGEFSLLN